MLSDREYDLIQLIGTSVSNVIVNTLKIIMPLFNKQGVSMILVPHS